MEVEVCHALEVEVCHALDLKTTQNAWSKGPTRASAFLVPVYAWKKLVQEGQFTRAPLSALAIPLNYLELHERSKICIFSIQSFLLLKHVKCLI